QGQHCHGVPDEHPVCDGVSLGVDGQVADLVAAPERGQVDARAGAWLGREHRVGTGRGRVEAGRGVERALKLDFEAHAAGVPAGATARRISTATSTTATTIARERAGTSSAAELR